MKELEKLLKEIRDSGTIDNVQLIRVHGDPGSVVVFDMLMI